MAGLSKKTILPKELKDMTLEELVETCDEFIIKDTVVTMKKDVKEGQFTLKFQNYTSDYLVRQRLVQEIKAKNIFTKLEYRDYVMELQKVGMTQMEISRLLGISQAYVSKLSKMDA